MIDELKSFGTPRFLCRPGVSHTGVIVPVGITVTRNLTPYRCPVASEQFTDLGRAKAGVSATHDRHPLIKAEPMAPATRPGQISRVG